MYRPINKHFKPKKQVARINEHIKVPEVRVVDEEGEHIGVMATKEALKLAQERELDLVEVSPTAKPPLAKIINYDKYRYQVEKKEQKQRKQTKRVDVKNVRLSLRIGQHDLEFKARQADKFLKADKKVKVEMFLRGRERANVEYAFEQINKYLQTIEESYNLEQAPKKMGHTITAMLSSDK